MTKHNPGWNTLRILSKEDREWANSCAGYVVSEQEALEFINDYNDYLKDTSLVVDE